MPSNYQGKSWETRFWFNERQEPFVAEVDYIPLLFAETYYDLIFFVELNVWVNPDSIGALSQVGLGWLEFVM